MTKSLTPLVVFDPASLGSSGTPTTSTVAFTTDTKWTIPSDVNSLDILVVGGGGAGVSNVIAYDTNQAIANAGGGAGGLIYISNWDVTGSSNLSITIGDGGTYGPSNAAQQKGKGTTVSTVGGTTRTLTSLGGGIGDWSNPAPNAGSGGSGGGAWADWNGGSTIPGAGLQPSDTHDGVDTYVGSGFGNAGGAGLGSQPAPPPYVYGGGGGGVGAPGESATDARSRGGSAGMGGEGKDFSTIFGSAFGTSGWFASGGSSAGYEGGLNTNTNTDKGGGGSGDNSNHNVPANTLSNGMANTGGGGGAGGHGGSGIVIIRYA